MAGKKDAAWWRDYRARKALEQQESKGLAATPQAQPPQPVAVEEARFAAGTSPKTHTVLTLAQRIAIGLAAPDDDCMTCGHDRQTTHPEGGKCGHGCLCRRFRPAGTDLVPCHLCGHDEFHGHAATPCDQWMGEHPCDCPAFVDPDELF